MEAADPWWGLEQDLQEQYERRSMVDVNKMMESKYLKQSDFPEDMIVTIEKIGNANIARDDAEPEYKWLVKFREFKKPMVLNKTNIQLLTKVCESTETEDWIGKEVVVYVDETVSYGGEIVGGLRIRANRAAAVPKKAGNVEDLEDDIPF